MPSSLKIRARHVTQPAAVLPEPRNREEPGSHKSHFVTYVYACAEIA